VTGIGAVFGLALIVLVLWDAFETVVLPRRVTRKYRLTRLFYRTTWHLWSGTVRRLFKGKQQQNYLSYFGPLSLIFLLSIWAVGLIFGFALLNWASGSPLHTPEGTAHFGTYVYLSGTTFFTLGLGDVAPLSTFGRVLTVVESGLGLGLLALVISYLPALNGSFGRREMSISLLDARAGSPPTAAEMLLRRCHDEGTDVLLRHLSEWERWAAEVLEGHLSYPVLAYFRSQHDNQSWIAALTVILDTSAFVLTAMEGSCRRQAQLTFAIARHAVVDLSLVFGIPPHRTKHERLPPEDFERLFTWLSDAGLPLRREKDVEEQLAELRKMYEPYIRALSAYLRLSVPPWISEVERLDNWQASAWEKGAVFEDAHRHDSTGDEHF
jgi:hypothetical protein